MALREKGGMWCSACARPVTARKTGRRVRNSASVAGAPLTAGLSLLFARSDRWHCSNCGGPVTRAPYSPAVSLRPALAAGSTATVILTDPGPKVPTIKVLRAVTGAHLAAADSWYRGAPSRIDGLADEVARDLVARLEQVGSKAEIEVPEPAASAPPEEQLRALEALREAGTLTAEEFERARRRLLEA